MKKEFDSWTIVGLFLSFFPRNFHVHQTCWYRMCCAWCTVYCVWTCVEYAVRVCGYAPTEYVHVYRVVYGVLCLCFCVSLLLYHRTSTRSTSTVLRAHVCSRAIRRIVRDIIFWIILWPPYQCTLYISTRNAILWSHGIAFCRTLSVNICGKRRITNLLFSELHLLSSPATHWMFHSLAPSPLFLLFLPFKRCSLCLWVAVLFGLRVLIDLLNQSTLLMSLWLSFLVLPSCRYCFLRTVLSRTSVFFSVQCASSTTNLLSTQGISVKYSWLKLRAEVALRVRLWVRVQQKSQKPIVSWTYSRTLSTRG